MKTETIEIRELIASEGKVLTDGTTYAKVVYLAPSAKVEDWWEIDEGDVPTDNIEDDYVLRGTSENDGGADND